MNKSIIPFIITFIAGISTLIGIIPTYINNKYKNYIIKSSILVSTLMMLLISITSLIPESYKYLNNKRQIIIYLIIGLIIAKYLDKFSESKTDNNLLKLGILSTITLIIHNIPEGIITYITSVKNINLGIKLSLAIALHNIPEGVIIAVPIYYSTNSRKKALLYTTISGFSETIGAILGKLFLYNISNNTLGIILSITAGIMIYISIFELSSKPKKRNVIPL